MEKIVNMRQLGGLINQQGMRIKLDTLFRSGNPSVASEPDRGKLEKLVIDEFIDFRSQNEKKDSEQLFAETFNWVAQPIFTGDLSSLLSNGLSKKIAVNAMHNIYQRFPVEFQHQFRYLLAQAEQGRTLLYHCTAGKDRTGFATMLLLSALGVDSDTILEDYLLSNEAVLGLKQQLASFMGDNVQDDAINAILEVTPDYLGNSLWVINNEYGGVEKYLSQTLAVDVTLIRNHYLEN